MRIAIASRIFDPEPSAASFRLGALASALARGGHEVKVLTVREPRALAEYLSDEKKSYRVARFPVLRDRSGYVRGYLQYMSFDVPLFFRVLFGRKRDFIVVEPPPTTGFFVRLAAALRRTPYAYYAADIWSDAAAQTGAPGFITRALAAVERWVLNGASVVLAVSPGVQTRLAELKVRSKVVMVGNGVDVSLFSYEGPRHPRLDSTFVYAGTASEWHGAEIFIAAMANVQQHHPEARLCFIGGGSEREKLRELADNLGVQSIEFLDPVPPAQLSERLRSCAASLASVLPGAGYDFAFPTKLYGSTAAGAPVIFSGVGPAETFVRTEVNGESIGSACAYDAVEVANAMKRVLDTPPSDARREEVSTWAHKNVDITSVAERIRNQIELAV